MKKIIIILFLILISCNFNQDKESRPNSINSIELTGNIENLKDSLTVTLAKIDRRNFYGKNIDSTLSLNGTFKFKIGIKEPSEYMIVIFDYKNKVAKRNLFWLENTDITLTGNYDDFEKAKINGSKIDELAKKYNAIGVKYANQMRKGKIGMKEYRKKQIKERIDFFYEYPNNVVSLSNILYFTDNINKDSIRLFYSKLEEQLKHSKNGIALKNSFEIERVKIGKPFIDIVAKDLKGNIVKISDYKDKVIVLDFWAVWCHNCHEQNQREFPKLKEKYKNEDFVIISYSVDVDKNDWERSSKKDKINWINISNLEGISDKYITQYGVQVYPTSFIIGKDGKVIKKIKGYEYNALETELDKIFKIE